MMLPALLASLLALAPAGEPASDTLEVRSLPLAGEEVQALCTQGPVEVLLLPDAPADIASWRPVLERLEGRVGACTWARIPTSGERGWFELLNRLAEVGGRLRAWAAPGSGTVARVAHPPVWVGDGAGGLYARLLAQDRPTAVGGLVLTDPETEGWETTLRRGMPPEAWRREVQRRTLPNRDGVRLEALLERAAAGGAPGVPLTVLTGLAVPVASGWTPRWVREARQRRHRDLVAGAVPGRHVPVPGARSALRRAPDAVVSEILRVVRLRERTAGRRGAP